MAPPEKKAVLNVDFDSLFEPSKPPSAKKRPTKAVVNPLFESMLPLLEDPFWIEKIKNASYGKFPRGFSFYNGCLNHKKGAKTQSLLLSSSPEEALKETISFFQNWGSIYSTYEQAKHNYFPPTPMGGETKPITWANASSFTKESLLFKYISEQKVLMNLTPAEVSSLRSALMTGVNNKMFNEENIQVEDSRIIHIDGLVWDGEYHRFYLMNEKKPEIKKNSKTRNTVGIGLIYKEWLRQNKKDKADQRVNEEEDNTESIEVD